jgi:hypothetical protein
LQTQARKTGRFRRRPDPPGGVRKRISDTFSYNFSAAQHTTNRIFKILIHVKQKILKKCYFFAIVNGQYFHYVHAAPD